VDLSIIIPTYDRIITLRRCLAAINEVRFEGSAEVVVVEDGGSEKSRSVLEAAELGIPFRWLWIRNLRHNPARARNTGAIHCSGQRLLFLDDDVIVSTELIRAHLLLHGDGHPVLGVGFHTRIHFDDWTASLKINEEVRDIKDPKISMLHSKFFKANPWAFASASHMSIERSTFLECGLFDEGFEGWGFEDTELAFRVFRAGLLIQFITEPAAVHLDIDNDALSGGVDRPPVAENRFNAFMRNADYFIDKYDNEVELERIIREDICTRLIGSPNTVSSTVLKVPSHLSLLTPYAEGDEFFIRTREKDTLDLNPTQARFRSRYLSNIIFIYFRFWPVVRRALSYSGAVCLIVLFTVWLFLSGRYRRLIH